MKCVNSLALLCYQTDVFLCVRVCVGEYGEGGVRWNSAGEDEEKGWTILRSQHYR